VPDRRDLRADPAILFGVYTPELFSDRDPAARATAICKLRLAGGARPSSRPFIVGALMASYGLIGVILPDDRPADPLQIIGGVGPGGVEPRNRGALGERRRERVDRGGPVPDRRNFALPQQKSGVSDFCRSKMPSSGKPEFGWRGPLWEREQSLGRGSCARAAPLPVMRGGRQARHGNEWRAGLLVARRRPGSGNCSTRSCSLTAIPALATTKGVVTALGPHFRVRASR